jgi:pyruvate dehydrogenase E1 component alpha subunit
MVEGLGLSATNGDGNDATEVYRIASEAIAGIRAGSGPRFLEFSTYRWCEHCGPNYDNDLGYRTESEFLEWKAKEPIGRFESSLRSRGVLSVAESGRMDAAIEREITAAFEFADAAPFPDAASAFEDLYAEPPAPEAQPECTGT